MRARLALLYAQLGARPRLLLLALWWVAVTSPVFDFVESYGTNLFQEVDASVDANGHVIVLACAATAAAAALAPAVFATARHHPTACHAAGTAAAAALIAALSRARHLWSAYVLWVLALAALQLQACVVQADTAHALADAQRGGAFAALALLSLLVQAILQVCALVLCKLQPFESRRNELRRSGPKTPASVFYIS